MFAPSLVFGVLLILGIPEHPCNAPFLLLTVRYLRTLKLWCTQTRREQHQNKNERKDKKRSKTPLFFKLSGGPKLKRERRFCSNTVLISSERGGFRSLGLCERLFPKASGCQTPFRGFLQMLVLVKQPHDVGEEVVTPVTMLLQHLVFTFQPASRH